MRRRAALLVAFSLSAPATAANDSDFFYTDDAAATLKRAAAIVDTRPLAACQDRSLRGARCLPASDFLGPHRRLPAIPDIHWVFGTAGLSGAESVLVIGDEPTARDFVARLLHLAGQRRIAILRTPVTSLPPDLLAPGVARAITREAVFQSSMRDDRWLLRGELAARLASGAPLALIDGRSESEFWGETVRAARGGHLPGADNLPVAALRAALSRREKIDAPAGGIVAYAHDAVESIAFFALARAGAGLPASVYPGGWAEWAAHGSLPADAATFPDRTAPQGAAPAKTQVSSERWRPIAAGTVMGVLLAIGGFYLGRRGRGRRMTG